MTISNTPQPETERRRWHFANAADERAYRAHFLTQDLRQMAIAIVVFTAFKASFAVFDIMVQTHPQAQLLLLQRFGFVLLSLLALGLLARVREAWQYDSLILGWTLLSVASNFFTIAHRPPDHFGFLSTSPILILLFFGFFRNRLPLQLLASLLLTLSDAFTLLFLREHQPMTAQVQIFATYGLAITVGLVVSWQLEATRRNHFAALTRERELTETLMDLAYRDELTGVLNRRSFLLQADETWQRLREQGRSACLLMLDLDHFKQVNDALGHEAGDRALMRFARQIDAGKRSGDLFGRIGGEEFALLMADIELDQAKRLADQMVARCRQLAAGESGEHMLSTSIGIARIAVGDRDLAATMKRADLALYRAKANGRNCAEIAADDAAAATDGMILNT